MKAASSILERFQKLNININVLNFKTLNSRDKQLADEIITCTAFLPESAKLRERLYCIEHNITSLILCENCGQNPVEFVKGQYRQYCSMKCLNSSKKHKQHCQDTCIQHFGVKHHSQSAELKEKEKQKNLEKYGVEYAFQAKEVIEKIKQAIQHNIEENPNYWKDRAEKSKQTNIENGHAPTWNNREKNRKTRKEKLENNPHCYDEANRKRLKTCIERYGSAVNVEKIKQTRQKHIAENPNYQHQINQKIKRTKAIRYGDENFNNIAKNKKTRFEKYGNENFNNIEKNKKTCLKKYGVSTFFKTEECLRRSAIATARKSYRNFIENNDFDIPMFSEDDYANRIDEHAMLKFKCKKCGNIFEAWHHDGHHRHCPKCYPHKISEPERKIAEFLKQLNLDVQTNNRLVISPYELDIYIPSKNIAIEFDGLYWHSEEHGITKNYHLNKTLACEKKGIQLIHIFENEWIYKQDIVKSRLKNLIGIYNRVVYARKCTVKEVDSKTSKEFQEETHLQGAVTAKVNLGLYDGNQLVALMTFGKCRFDKKHEWEMLRFCCKLGCRVVGGAGKLLKHFERNWHPKSLISYADRRWSQGKLYKTLGFKLDHASIPNYWYWKNANTLESRIKYQKHKLKDILETYDENLSEAENMRNNGYHRIYDCGNLVFEK